MIRFCQKTCPLGHLNFHAKNTQFKGVKSIKCFNFRAKIQIENPWILDFGFKKFKYFIDFTLIYGQKIILCTSVHHPSLRLKL